MLSTFRPAYTRGVTMDFIFGGGKAPSVKGARIEAPRGGGVCGGGCTSP